MGVDPVDHRRRPAARIRGDDPGGGGGQGGEDERVRSRQPVGHVGGGEPSGQGHDLEPAGGHGGEGGGGGGVALEEPVVVAVGGVPGHRQARGPERCQRGGEEARSTREPVLGLVQVAGRARIVGVPVVDVVRQGVLVHHALVPRPAAVGGDRPAVEQGQVPLQLVDLGVVDVVTGGDGAVVDPAGHRAAPDVVDPLHHGLGHLGGQRLLGAVGRLEGEGGRRLVAVAVEELDPGRALGVDHVDVREVHDTGQCHPP